MKKVVIYPVKEMMYDKVLRFVSQYAPKRYQYISKFYRKEDRYNSAVAYVLLCIVYNRIIEEFKIGRFGKPYFTQSNQFLSISHTKGIISVAISDADIAIDCEIDQFIDQSIVDMTFTKKEKLQVKNGTLNKSEIWTAKEAISKFYNEDWYSFPRTEIMADNGVVYDKNNIDLILEFTRINDTVICIVSKSRDMTDVFQISEATILDFIK